MVLFSVEEGLFSGTTIATLVFSGAVDQVWLGQVDELVSLDLMSSLKSTSGGESPARSTITLVLYWGNSTKYSPVN